MAAASKTRPSTGNARVPRAPALRPRTCRNELPTGLEVRTRRRDRHFPAASPPKFRRGSADARTWLGPLLLLALAAGCGGGTDGGPVAPPTAPTPLPTEPTPEPPAQVTGVEAVEVGLDFIVWAWNPVEGATGYEAVPYLAGTPPTERGAPVFTEKPSLRTDGLEPGTRWEIHVRALRTTVGGRAVGPWSDQVAAETRAPPRRCTNERELALAFGAGNGGPGPLLLQEWDGTPFEFVFDNNAADLVPDDDIEAVFEIVRELGFEIEAQLGYPIIEVSGWTRCHGWNPAKDCSGRQRGQAVGTVEWTGTVATSQDSGAAAAVRRGVIYWTNGAINVAGNPHQWAAPHELFHLWGFTHHPESRHAQAYPPTPGEGVEMSVTLTDWTRSREMWPTWADIDALGCVLPHPDFPRD